MLPLLARTEVLGALVRRWVALEQLVADYVREKGWLREVVDDVPSGALRLTLDEDWGWQPPPEDPGHQMTADREKYRALLER